ncbi:hypothetical protein [Dactylosporangium darangshiense]|uniref:PknH-like extracellular domain-containing protein n=1 Tax=Dactylosporangium darangshiense TaxID=579108 RepID=A0ABP8DUM2_9ACTN
MYDHLSERFIALDADVSRHARIVAPDRVRARGDRRRIGVATTSAVAVGAFAALATVGANVADGSNGAGTSVESYSARLGIPASLRLPHEGEAGWRADDNVAIPAVFASCAASDPTLPGRTDVRGATGPGRPDEEAHLPTRVTEQLVLFDSELAAKAAIAGLVAAGQACGWIDPGMASQLDATHLTGQYPDAELVRVKGIQTGNSIFLISTTTHGSLMSSVGSDELSLIAARLCTILNLCHPAPGVSPLTEGSAESPDTTGSLGSSAPVGASAPPLIAPPAIATRIPTSEPGRSPSR